MPLPRFNANVKDQTAMDTRPSTKRSILPSTAGYVWGLLISLLLTGVSVAEVDNHQIEKTARQYTASDEFRSFRGDGRCHDDRSYRVYLIDNFNQGFYLVPEVLTSHGEMLVRLLRTGRDDIDVSILNTSLSKGLALVIHDLMEGECVDAVVSSIPGSNYTYEQINSLFFEGIPITPENILSHRSALRELLRTIAFHGFPSVEWLIKIEVNSVKLGNDARKFTFIEALGRFNVPVILPYGNSDTRHNGQIRSVNLLSLASNAKVYSALDQRGKRVEGFPYSPLSSGDEPAVYDIVECPHPDDPFKTVLDINEDGHREYTSFRSGKIAYRNGHGMLDFAPPVLRQDQFVEWMARVNMDPERRFDKDIVLTAAHYRELIRVHPMVFDRDTTKSFVWLNSPDHGRVFDFDPACWERGKISGTSVIPPHKLKELLPPKAERSPRDRNGGDPGG